MGALPSIARNQDAEKPQKSRFRMKLEQITRRKKVSFHAEMEDGISWFLFTFCKLYEMKSRAKGYDSKKKKN